MTSHCSQAIYGNNKSHQAAPVNPTLECSEFGNETFQSNEIMIYIALRLRKSAFQKNVLGMCFYLQLRTEIINWHLRINLILYQGI